MTLLRMAAGYRQSAEMIRLRIISLKDEARRAQHTDPGDCPGAGEVLRQEVSQK